MITQGQLEIECTVTEFKDSNAIYDLPTPEHTAKGLRRLLKTKMNEIPDVRFIFQDGQVLYDHSNLLKNSSSYMETLLESGFAEVRPATTLEAWANECDKGSLHSGVKSRVQTAVQRNSKRDWLRDFSMVSIVVQDFSYVE